MDKRDVRRTWGIAAIVAIVALIGYGVWTAVGDVETGIGPEDEDIDIIEEADEPTARDNETEATESPVEGNIGME